VGKTPKMGFIASKGVVSSFHLRIAALCAILLLAAAVRGAVVRKELTITWGNGAPNGQSRDMIFTNGQFPSPNLIFDEDDDVEVCANAKITKLVANTAQITVHNKMPFNTTIHWHGLT
jgi:hypothetical protein